MPPHLTLSNADQLTRSHGKQVVLLETTSSGHISICSQARLKDFADNDPAVMEQMVKETREALEATNR